MLRKKRSKKPTAKDYEAIIKIQERIIIAHEKIDDAINIMITDFTIISALMNKFKIENIN